MGNRNNTKLTDGRDVRKLTERQLVAAFSKASSVDQETINLECMRREMEREQAW